jgi:hypothetical protein
MLKVVSRDQAHTRIPHRYEVSAKADTFEGSSRHHYKQALPLSQMLQGCLSGTIFADANMPLGQILTLI